MNKVYGFLVSVEAEDAIDAPSIQLILSDALSMQGVKAVEMNYLGAIEVYEDESETSEQAIS